MTWLLQTKHDAGFRNVCNAAFGAGNLNGDSESDSELKTFYNTTGSSILRLAIRARSKWFKEFYLIRNVGTQDETRMIKSDEGVRLL